MAIVETRRSFLKYHLLVYLWAAWIFLISSFPLAQVSTGIFTDKIGHLIQYGILGFLLARVLQHALNKPSKAHVILITIALGTLYGLSDEIHQIFVPLRRFELLDLVADATGCLLGGFTRQILFRSK